MDKSDAERIFKNYYRYKDRRDALMEQIEVLTARATKITPNFDPDKVGSAPFTNPKPSKVERYAIKIVSAREQIKKLNILLSAGDELFDALRPHQRYLVRCMVCNGMSAETFAKQADIKPLTAKKNLEKIYKLLEKV